MEQAEQFGLHFERLGSIQSPLPGRFEITLHNEYRHFLPRLGCLPRPRSGNAQRERMDLQRSINGTHSLFRRETPNSVLNVGSTTIAVRHRRWRAALLPASDARHLLYRVKNRGASGYRPRLRFA